MGVFTNFRVLVIQSAFESIHIGRLLRTYPRLCRLRSSVIDYGNNFLMIRIATARSALYGRFSHIRRPGAAGCCRSYTATVVTARSRGVNFRL
jgi:hypothetical protein